MKSALTSIGTSLLAWLNTDAAVSKIDKEKTGFSWVRCLPFIAIHLGCLGVIYTGFSATVLWVALGLYFFRVFALTAFYHRYFSHRAFKTNRFWQLMFAIAGMTAIQRGPLWWAAHHRRHHLYSDTEEDAHSPLKSIWWSHFGWFTCARHFATHYEIIRDFSRYPELVFLNRFDWLVPVCFLGGLYTLGEWLATTYPHLQTNGLQMLVWGGAISTVAAYHATFCVNSVCHLIGKRSYATNDHSRNNWLVALLTFGEGWHNNHHYYPGSAKQGFMWWQIDITYQILRILQLLRIVKNLKPVPQKVLHEATNQ